MPYREKATGESLKGGREGNTARRVAPVVLGPTADSLSAGLFDKSEWDTMRRTETARATGEPTRATGHRKPNRLAPDAGEPTRAPDAGGSNRADQPTADFEKGKKVSLALAPIERYYKLVRRILYVIVFIVLVIATAKVIATYKGASKRGGYGNMRKRSNLKR